MRAALFRRHGGPEVMEVGDVPGADARAGRGAGARHAPPAMNHIDLWLRQGLPALPVAFPHVAGGDVCGVVSQLGPGVRADAGRGARAIASSSTRDCRAAAAPPASPGGDNFCPDYRMLGEQTQGGQAEYVVVPAANLVPAPRARVAARRRRSWRRSRPCS